MVKRSKPLPVLVAITILVVLFGAAWGLYTCPDSGRALSFSLMTGLAFGIVLQRSRFCFFCNLRDLLERRDSGGVLAILVALGAGVVLYAVVIAAWMPVPQPNLLPPNAHVGPVGPVLAIAAFVFGVGMALSGSCISAHLYRLGEGSPTAPFAILGAGLGFVAGFLTWNPLYLAFTSEGTAIWLPHSLGYGGTLLVSLAAILVLAALALRLAPLPAHAPDGPRTVFDRIFVDRWPAIVGGLAVAVISMAAYLRVAPLGVTVELGSIARTGAGSLGLLPGTLYGLDELRGCATVIKEALLSNNGLFVGGLVAGSFAAALPAGQFRPARPRAAQLLRGLAGGALMGWGAMTALGCTVGVLLSGIHAGALSGWIFLGFCTLGVAVALPLTRRLP